MSGLIYIFVAIGILYFVLKRIRPAAGFELWMITSFFIGAALIRAIQITILHENPFRFLEHFLTAGCAVLLINTQLRVWAWCLLVDSILCVITFLLLAKIHMSKGVSPQIVAFRILLHLVMTWLIAKWLYKQKLPTNLKPLE